jgi:ATP-dependent helicase/nuclease subunit B
MTLASPEAASPCGLTECLLPWVRFVADCARQIVVRHGGGTLQQSVLLVPDLHCVSDVSRALHAAAASPVLLLPRITTLRAWAADVPLDRAVMGDAARELILYRTLAERGWFDRADLWSVCADLCRLFDELTRERITLPREASDFAEWLKVAYGRHSGSALDFEARLVHDMWSAFGVAQGALDSEAAYVMRLARLAEAAPAPLHVIGPSRLSRSETEFLNRYAQRSPVWIYRPESDASNACEQTLAAAWPLERESYENLRERAQRLKSACSVSAVAGRLRIAGASNPEHEAQIVDTAVRERLVTGRQRIAVVVQDRITARRARALLERSGVLVSEEAGWAFSTTSAATIISRWLDAMSGNFYYQHLLDVLKSPFVFCDQPRRERQQAVWRLEQWLRKANVIAGLDNFIACAETGNNREAQRMLGAMKTAARLFDRRRAPPARWLALLMQSLVSLGVRPGYAQDAAGEQLWELLEQLRQELADEAFTITFGEWRQWLARKLDNASFRDRSIDSPVIFTYLSAVGLRAFDAVVIVGGDAAHLPEPDCGSLFFNQQVRAQLALPKRSEQVRATEEALTALIARCDDIVVTWQRVIGGEENLLSPQFERLSALHRLAYGTGLDDMAMPERARRAALRAPAAIAPAPSAKPSPAAAAGLIRPVISASAYNALMVCPYQYYARYILGLAEVDAVQELIEKSDYGERVHHALAAFHREYPRVSNLERGQAEAALALQSDAAFAEAVATNYLARAWVERWKALIPQYVAWQCKREAQGWRVIASEAVRTLEIRTPRGHALTLRGRIDRVDADNAGHTALIDYKTQRRERLRAKAEADGEDIQLPFYALLWGGPVAAALFLGMERDGITSHELKGELDVLARDVCSRLAVLHDAIHEGAPLPAHGVDDVCEYCEMSGLCRRAHWS